MPPETDYYVRLGIPDDATPDQIRQAYRDATRRLHPDVNVKPGATEFFLDVKEAYEVLIDPGKRAVYDGSFSPKDQPVSPVRSKIIYSRETLPKISDPQLVYALIELDVIQELVEEIPPPPLNIALVIDSSTSMQGTRMDLVKSSAIELTRQLKPSDVISIIAFNDYAEVVVPATARSGKKAGIESRIKTIQSSGGTEIFQGLKTGMVEVRHFLKPAYTNHIILLTDGHTYGDEIECQQLADQAASLGIGISGLGIGTNWNDNFIDDLTARTGGTSVYISKPKDIRRLLLEKLEGLGQICAERVNFEYNLVPGVELRYAFRLKPEVGVLRTTPPIYLGNIPKSGSHRILLEFLVDPIFSDVDRVLLAEGRILFDIPNQATSFRMPITLIRPLVDRPDLRPPPKIIVEALSRLTLYRMQEEAKKELAEGKIEEATQRLQNLATNLFTSGERELARVVLNEAQHIRQSQSFSSEGAKVIKYGTRALLLPHEIKEL